MFDIGFMELMLISIVALIVIGPEKLPGAIRTATLWIGRAKRSFQQVKSEIEREINADDIKRQLHNEAILADLKKVKDKADALVEDTKGKIDDAKKEFKKEQEQLESSIADDSKGSKTPTTPTSSDKKRETPAAPVDDPSSIDDPDADLETVASEPEEDAAKEQESVAEQAPTHDFYNNPPSGTVKVEGGIFRPTSSLDDETDSGRRS